MASRNSISRLVARIVPPHEIEDIVQETYVRICQVDNKEKISSPKSFMYKTARNLALDFKKQAGVRLVDGVENVETLDSLLDNEHVDEMFHHAATDSEFAQFCEAVRQLPIQCRKVFVLKKVYGYSQKEIAAQLELSESTVEKHIATGLRKCMMFMQKAKTASNSGKQESNVSVLRSGGRNE